MTPGLIYIHGKNGTASEANHYKTLFPDYDVTGFDYVSQNPWDAEKELSVLFDDFSKNHKQIILVANSIGAFFAVHALKDKSIEKALFISPIVNMEKLITDMMSWSGISEKELKTKKEIETDFGEKLSWNYLKWVREHPVSWNIPTSILYGSNDQLQSVETINQFARKIKASVTVMEGGEHWFHTKEQMDFLDLWAKEFQKK